MGVMIGLATGAVAIGGAFALQTASRIAAEEIKDWLPFLVEKLLILAIERLPTLDRERYREEWAADLFEYPGKLTQVIRAGGFYCAALRISAVSSQDDGIRSEFRTRLKLIFQVPRLRVLFLKGVSFQACLLAFETFGIFHYHWSFLSNTTICVIGVLATHLFVKWLIRRDTLRAVRKALKASV